MCDLERVVCATLVNIEALTHYVIVALQMPDWDMIL
jgi:hypothetical protein